MEPLIRRLTIWTSIYLTPAVWLIRPVLDPDIWWHIRTGEWVLEHGWVTSTDPFSLFGADKNWLAYSWLFEIGLYSIHLWLGLSGILLFRFLMSLGVVGAFHLFLSKRTPRFLIVAPSLFAAAIACAPIFTARPWLLTVIFATWTLSAVLSILECKDGWQLWFLPIAYVIWANTHIQFVYGLIILSLGLMAALFELLGPRIQPYLMNLGISLKLFLPVEGDRDARDKRWLRLGLLLLACLLATLVNPYQVEVYRVIFEYATQPAAYKYVNELTPPTFRSIPECTMLALGGLALAIVARQKRIPIFQFLFLLGSAYLAFRSKREVWMLTLAAFAVFTAPPFQIPQPESTEEEDVPITLKWRAVALGVIIAVACSVAWSVGLNEAGLQEYVAQKYPVKAVEHIRSQGYSGPLFNHFNWGGYLIWALPELKVQMDGRTNLHGNVRLDQTVATWSGRPPWKDDPDLFGDESTNRPPANIVIAPVDRALAELLRKDDRFRIDYEDDVAAIFVQEKLK